MQAYTPLISSCEPADDDPEDNFRQEDRNWPALSNIF
jgi:hypothetical protein